MYVVTYLIWSRILAFEMSDHRTWCFYHGPVGLMSEELERRYNVPGRDPMDVWMERERLPAFVFRPCIWLDQALTKRRYWPGSGIPQMDVDGMKAPNHPMIRTDWAKNAKGEIMLPSAQSVGYLCR